jgi:hypothetical protein
MRPVCPCHVPSCLYLQDAEARIELLRQRAGLGKAKSGPSETAETPKGVEDQPRAGPSSLTSGGHINLFEDFERVSPCLFLLKRDHHE